jgi:hypothetical protein
MHGQTGKELIASARKAMLMAREAGGNRVEAYPEEVLAEKDKPQ